MNHHWRDVRANPSLIIRRHLGSYRHAATGQMTVGALVELLLLPIVAVALSLVFRADVGGETGGALIAVAGLVGAFLFSAMLGIATRAMEWEGEGPPPGPATSSRAKLLEQLAANAGYAAIVSVMVVVCLTVASIENGEGGGSSWIGIVATALGLGLGVHLVLTLLMVMKRVFAATQGSLYAVRGGSAHDRHARK